MAAARRGPLLVFPSLSFSRCLSLLVTAAKSECVCILGLGESVCVRIHLLESWGESSRGLMDICFAMGEERDFILALFCFSI